VAQASACAACPQAGALTHFDNRIPLSRASLIVNGQRSTTANTAMRLAHYFGTSAQMWMNLQTAYDLEVAQKKAAAIKREVIPASKRAA
jgi:plasmid maintenance system antidote protein VapI